ncbi:uncharacterized protein LOC105215879 isoform X2 [Zeugodacus cucurbitae]|uniref:uncharacterized protein LOC105215879 isoform X2 n=1 Tax=Zeugodacus cucurbitae TaxID=28588 RepID=UPI0023D9253E|nr:uncharacterized protein LOC105215879 isoform X2 [Zeugodacus cucurbitae]
MQTIEISLDENSRSYVTLGPQFSTALAGETALIIDVEEAATLNASFAQFRNTSDSVLVLMRDENYVTAYNNRPTSVIITCMICAWILLIISVTICCFSQCGVMKRAKSILHGAAPATGQQQSGRRGAQQHSDRTNPEPVEICRHFPPDYEVESLPSYTIVSGLPTYDDALEEFRKAGIILTPPMPVVKIFEKDPAAAGSTGKENQIFNMENGISNDNDNISVTSTCTCGAANNANSNNPNSIYTVPSPLAPQVIELSPEQLAALSQKRLSLQITFNNTARRNSRPRGIDLYRQVNRNNLLRSQAVAAAAAARDGFPQIHRSSSTLTLSNEPNMLDRHLMQHLQHRGSLY